MELEGIQGGLRFSELVQRPDVVGNSLAHLDLSHADRVTLLEAGLGTSPTRESLHSHFQVVLGYIAESLRLHGRGWVDEVLNLPGLLWDDNHYANFAWALPAEQETWDRLERWGEGAAALYWLRTPIHFLADPNHDSERAVSELLKAKRPYRALYILHDAVKPVGQGTKPIYPFPRDLVRAVLRAAPKASAESEWYPIGLDMLGYHVSSLFEALEEHGEEQLVMAELEWRWLPVLRREDRGLRTLHAALADNPAFFVQVLGIVFRSKREPHEEFTSVESARAEQGYHLLEEWKRIPGSEGEFTLIPAKEGEISFPSGDVSEEKLRQWVLEARRLATESGQIEVCDSRIGQMLAHSPVDQNGTWPCGAVRSVIEEICSDALDGGIRVGVWNRRGAHFRGRGGEQERHIAAMFQKYANKVQSKWPRTGTILVNLVREYEEEARRQDARSEFEEWE